MSEIITAEELATWTDAADWVDNSGRIESTIKSLEAELDADKKMFEDQIKVRDALKAELEITKVYKATAGKMEIDRDAWKQKAERLAGALRKVESGTCADYAHIYEIAKAALAEYSQAHGFGEER